MPKRKRDSDLDSPSTGDHAFDLKISCLKVRIEQGIAQLKKALTLARGLERQKLGRRQKTAAAEPQVLLKLREEVIVLRQLDLGLVAERQLLRRLRRVKRVNENVVYGQVYAGRQLEGPKNEAEANVVGRLMNSSPVKTCLLGVVGSVMEVLGLEGGSVVKRKSAEGRSGRSDAFLPGKAQVNGLTRAEDDEWSGPESEAAHDISMDDETDLGSGTGSKSVSSVEHNGSILVVGRHSDSSAFDARVAASSDSASDATASDLGSLEKNEQRSTILESHSNPKTKISSSGGSSPPTLFESLEPTKKLKRKAEAEPKPISSTAFLPSLMMGGYYSGSESASDIDDARDKRRKNRRGQRARQKIAEAKFGARAKHLSKQSGGRNAGWDPKRGAIDGTVNSRGRMRIGRPAISNSKGLTGANGNVLGTRKKEIVKDGPLHPSWEASRKRKEQAKKISISTAGTSLGNKITFD